jgi:signal transduction histidine kinase/DNA-binding NarL/FixJ family response regulator
LNPTQAIRRIWRLLTEPSAAIPEGVHRSRARLVAPLILPFLAAALVGSATTPNPIERQLVHVLLPIFLVAYLLARTRWYQAGATLVAVALLIGPYYMLVAESVYTEHAVVRWFSWTALPLLLASIWLPMRHVSSLWLVNIALILGAPLFIVELDFRNVISSALQGFLVGAVILLGTRMRNKALERARQQSLALMEARDAAEAASRAKSEFMANISHEIRTPMNGVLGTLELLTQTELNARQQNFLGAARLSAEALMTVLNDVLDFSKIESGRLELESVRFDVAALVREVTAMFADRAATKGIRLGCAIDPALAPFLSGDPLRLRQVLANLVSNAVKFTERGEVNVHVGVTEDVPDWQQLQVDVRDTGIGIPQEALARLFQPFVQADATTTRRFGGTGLGLVIARRLIEQMQGTIDVESRENQGSLFRIRVRLPRDMETQPLRDSGTHAKAATAGVESPVRADRAPDSAGPSLFAGYRVLLVEDNPVNRDVAVAMLEQAGVDVTAASDGRRAIAQHEQRPFDLILMDCQMPVLDGYEATRALRQLEKNQGWARTPIVALTANAMEGDRERCLRAGMDDYLSKPVHFESLQQTLAAWLAGTVVGTTPPSAGSGTPDVDMDMERLTQLRELMGVERYRDFMEQVLGNLDRYIRDLRAAFATHDYVGLQRTAHTIKGSLGTLGANRVATQALRLEACVRNKDAAPAIEAATGDLVAELESLRTMLKAQPQTQVP